MGGTYAHALRFINLIILGIVKLEFFFVNIQNFLYLFFCLRKIALVIILTRAGLGLDAKVLKKHYKAVLKLGLLPWLVECIAIAVTSHFLIHLPWIWGELT